MKKFIIAFLLASGIAGATGYITNSSIATNAAIALNKLAATTVSKVACTDSSGFLSACSMSSAFLDATSSIQTQLNGKQASGTYVTSLTVASSNGLAGSSSGGATPALTLSTSVTGSVCGNGTAFSACTTTGSGSTVLATGPTMTNPLVGTQSANDNSTKAASTAYVDAAALSAPAAVTLTQCTTARTVDWSTGNVFILKLTSGSACTLTFSNPSAKSIVLWISNDSASSGTATLVWPTAKWFPAGAPVMTTGTSALDVYTCTYNGTSYACNGLQNGG